MRRQKNISNASGNEKKAGIAILRSDKTNFKTKTVPRDKGGHYIMIKRLTQQEDITVINMYASNMGTPKYIKQILTNIKRKIYSNTIIVGDFNTSVTSMDSLFRQKINKETLALNDTFGQMELIDTYKIFHPKQQNTHSFQMYMEYSSA